MKYPRILLPVLALLAGPATSRAADATAPRSTTLSIYDSGFALVSELRSVTLAGAEERVVVKSLPARLDPQSVSFEAVGGGKGFEVVEQRFEHDLAAPAQLLTRYRNRPIQVRTAEGLRQGRLAGDYAAGSSLLQLVQPDGTVVRFPDPAGLVEVLFPEAERNAFLDPTLIWQAKSAGQGPQNLRLSYLVQGLRWEGAYEVVLNDDGNSARLAARVALENGAGGSFRDARVKLVLTERGVQPPPEIGAPPRPYDPTAQPAQRYAYGTREPVAEPEAASLAPVQTFEMPRPVTLGPGERVYLQVANVERLPVSRFHVYDGVRFDRFQRNRRNDWNYGTEHQTVVDTHVEFENTSAAGLGFALPPGRVNLYRRGEAEALDLLGSEVMPAVAAGGKGHVRLGPSRGLLGERERTGYSEVKPLHEYEESFEIRLANDSDQTAEVRVVEHLYRWNEYEIVKSDLEYQTIGPQTIEFRPELKPGGRRSIHYTVRYRW